MTPKTQTQRMHWMYGVDALRMIESYIHDYALTHRAYPDDWDQIWQDRDRRDAKRTQINIRMDADVVRFFKAMGPGYQHRINRVLRAFMHLRLARIIEGPDTTDYVLRPEEVMARVRDRGDWGDIEADWKRRGR